MAIQTPPGRSPSGNPVQGLLPLIQLQLLLASLCAGSGMLN